MELTPDQTEALGEIIAARHSVKRHLLTGYAGTGKTTLMQEVVRAFGKIGLEVILTAPTHKAVSVLKRKTKESGIEVECRTIHSLLSLRPVVQGPKTKLVRNKKAQHKSADVVVVDECSMLDVELLAHIQKHLGHVFVLYVGDPAQLPPVGEKESLSFQTKSKSHLTTIVRQAADNPVIQAAHIIRKSQGGKLDMSWCKRQNKKPFGVYTPNGQTDEWMKKAFLSPEFKEDNDMFRYLCWTNDRVAEVNSKVRQWIYGKTIEPFSVGENAFVRAPILTPFNPRQPLAERSIIFNTNDEVPVIAIRAGIITGEFCERGEIKAWECEIPAWEITLAQEDGPGVVVKIPRDFGDFDAVNNRLVAEAKRESARWAEPHDFAQNVARLQSVYSMTVHNSQGSTFRNVFLDVKDINRRARTNILETQQLFYVAATRASHALILVNL